MDENYYLKLFNSSSLILPFNIFYSNLPFYVSKSFIYNIHYDITDASLYSVTK